MGEIVSSLKSMGVFPLVSVGPEFHPMYIVAVLILSQPNLNENLKEIINRMF